MAFIDSVAAGALLGHGADYIRILARKGALPAFRSGNGRWLFKEEDVLAYKGGEIGAVPYTPQKKK